MTIDQLKSAVARALNESIDIPLVSEGTEQAFFEYVVQTIWQRLPASVQFALSSASAYIDPAELTRVQDQLSAILAPLLKTILPWRKDTDAIAASVQSELLALCAPGHCAGPSA